MKRDNIIDGHIKSYVGGIGDLLMTGKVTGTTITFGVKFIDEPNVTLTPLAASGRPESHLVSLNQDEDGFYTTATITFSGCDKVHWFAAGRGIKA